MLISSNLLLAKVAFWIGKTQQGGDLIKRAREIAIKILKDDDLESYKSFLQDYITISFMFLTEQTEFEMLLKVHDEMTEVKAKIDGQTNFDTTNMSNLDVPFLYLRYEILKKTSKREETYKQGILAITAKIEI